MPKVPSDFELAQLIKAGDPEAFSELYKREYLGILRYVSSLVVGDPSIAEDITNEVFLRAWRGSEKFQWRGKPFHHWLIRAAKFAAIDQYRKVGRRRYSLSLDEFESDQLESRLVISSTSVAAKAESNYEKESLFEALSKLPDDQKSVIILRFFEGYSHDEVAEALGKSTVAIRQIQSRALRNMRRLMVLVGYTPE